MYWRVWIIGFCLWCVLCFFYRMCLSWTRRASVSDQKSTRMISLLQIHLFHPPHPSHTLSSQPQKHFPLSLSSPLLNVNSEHFFLAWEHTVIFFFVALFFLNRCQVIPSHQIFFVLLFSLPKLRHHSVWTRRHVKKRNANKTQNLLFLTI